MNRYTIEREMYDKQGTTITKETVTAHSMRIPEDRDTAEYVTLVDENGTVIDAFKNHTVTRATLTEKDI